MSFAWIRLDRAEAQTIDLGVASTLAVLEKNRIVTISI